MKLLYNHVFLEHETGDHPENKKRLSVLGNLPETEINDDEKYLTLFHTRDYIEKVRTACTTSAPLDPDTLTSPSSFKAAVAAVNTTVMASESNDFALVRPPGHHAYPDHGAGFCIFNNIAIAAANLVAKGKRVFIFDFDGHLGDGTEEFFYKSNKVLYWSFHEREAFPQKGDYDEIGKGEGAGYTINIPLPKNSGDDVYLNGLKTFTQVALQFKPDVVAVSAGFDAHKDDPLLNLNLSNNTYYRIGSWLHDNFQNVFATLEGGYNLATLKSSLSSFLEGMEGKEKTDKEAETESTIQVIDDVNLGLDRLRQNLAKFWKI